MIRRSAEAFSGRGSTRQDCAELTTFPLVVFLQNSGGGLPAPSSRLQKLTKIRR